MSFLVKFENYPDSWMLPYGQTLLFKHLLIIPLLVYAIINSLFVKKKLIKDSTLMQDLGQEWKVS